MSVHHKLANGAPDNRYHSDRDWVAFCNDHPLILTWLSRPRKISYDYHIPYLGGISTDGSVVFLDSRYDPVLSLQYHRLDSALTLPDHEITEYVLIRFYGFQYDPDNPDRSSHVWGNTAERLAVRGLDADWDEYNEAIDRQLKGIELEKVEHCPPNLALYPYQGDKELLAKIRKAQEN